MQQAENSVEISSSIKYAGITLINIEILILSILTLKDRNTLIQQSLCK